MKVLMTGAGGQVGRALLAMAPNHVELLALTRRQLDIADCAAVHRTVADFQPALIINAAAYTAVDKAEVEPELATAINSDGPGYLAQAAYAVPGCRMLHISTDYVFDGRASVAYAPGHATNPLNVYGHTKRKGEAAVLEVLRERAVVMRTAWVYAAEGKNFVLTMLRLMRELGSVRVVADQHGTPTSATSIARALWMIAQRPDTQRILHWTDSGRTTWYELAVAIAEDASAAGLLSKPVQIQPISTADYPTPALRPANSELDCRESVAQLGLTPVPWRASLRATLATLQ